MAVTPLPQPEPSEMIVIDANSLTLGELEEIEDLTGRNVTAELGKGTPSARTLTALIWVIKRRTDPGFTIEDARKINVAAFQVEAQTSPKGAGG